MYKILIVEDETEMRKLLTKYIETEESGLHVVGSAVNGKEAWELFHVHKPDIVLTDIFMPVMNGLELLGKIKKSGATAKGIIISGYDEFEYAKSAISLGVSDYLLKPFDKDELKHVMEKVCGELDKEKVLQDNFRLLKTRNEENSTVLKQVVFENVLLGKHGSEVQIAQYFDTSAKWYCAALLDLMEAGIVNSKDCREDKVSYICELINAGCLSGNSLDVYAIKMDAGNIAMILSSNMESETVFKNKVKQTIVSFQKSMKRHYAIRFACVISEICSDWKEIALCYESVKRKWKSNAAPEEKIIFCNEECAVSNLDSDSLSRRIKELNEEIMIAIKRDETDFLLYLDELIKLYALLAPKKLDYVIFSAEEMVFHMFDELERKGIQYQEIKTNEVSVREIISKIESMNLMEIRELLKQFFIQCRRLLLDNRQINGPDRLIEEIKEIISLHLDDTELSLEWIAEKMHFSFTYIRQTFKTKTDERISEYIIRKRMEKASQLLLKTDMKIQEVTEACGYSNQRYFARSFKKYYECTPSEFKELMIKWSGEEK